MRNFLLSILKCLPIWASFLALNACSYVSAGQSWSIDESEVLFVSRTLPPCGIFYTLVEMQLLDRRNKRHFIYLPCVEVIEGPLPKPGIFCTAKGKMEYVNGTVASGAIPEMKPVKLAHELTCDGKTYVFDL